jgi:hypothetical protein
MKILRECPKCYREHDWLDVVHNHHSEIVCECGATLSADYEVTGEEGWQRYWFEDVTPHP